MATHLVKTPADFTPACKAAKAGDIIKLGRGLVLPETGMPNMEFPAKTPVVITSESETDMATLRGINLQRPYKGNLAKVGDGTKFGGLVFDGLKLEATKISKVGSYVLKKAVGWRTGPGGEFAAMVGFRLGTGCHDLVFRNIIAKGYGKQWSINQAKNILFEYIDNVEHCEDCYIIWGGDGLTWRFCRQGDFDGLDAEDAQKGFGWKLKIPPHADYFQFAGPTSNVLIEDCTMNDKTVRVHGILMNDPSKSGNRIYKNFTIRRNRFDLSHTTAYFGGHCTNFEYSSNKFVKIADGDNDDTCARFLNLGGRVVINNNVGRKIEEWAKSDHGDWAWQNNVISNDASVLPQGYIERRKGIAKPGDAAGFRYGDGGGVPPELDSVLEAIKAKAAIGSKWKAGSINDGVVRTVTGYSLATTQSEAEVWVVEYTASGSPTVPRTRIAGDFFALYVPVE